MNHTSVQFLALKWASAWIPQTHPVLSEFVLRACIQTWQLTVCIQFWCLTVCIQPWHLMVCIQLWHLVACTHVWNFNMTCIQVCQPSFCLSLVCATWWWYLHMSSHTYKSSLTKFWLSFATSLPPALHLPVCHTTSVCAPNFGFHLDTASRC